MPTYEFACPSGHEFEKFYKMSEAPSEAPCPQCGAAAVRRISGGAGLVFKGSGFYLTDYGKNAHRTTGDAAKKVGDGDAKGGGESKAEPKGSESKGGESKAAGGSATSDAPKAGGAKAPAGKPSAPKKGE